MASKKKGVETMKYLRKIGKDLERVCEESIDWTKVRAVTVVASGVIIIHG